MIVAAATGSAYCTGKEAIAKVSATHAGVVPDGCIRAGGDARKPAW